MTSDFQLKPGHFGYYVVRIWILLKLLFQLASSEIDPIAKRWGGGWHAASLLPGRGRNPDFPLGLY